MRVLKELGERITFLRRERKWTREDLASKSGLSSRFLADVESGRGNISIGRLVAICEAFEISPAVLFSKIDGTVGNRDSSLFAQLSALDSEQLEELRLWMSHRFDSRKKVISLVGLRGAGKTTIGKKVAARLRMKFIELDELVEKAAGLTLQNIFEVHGEEYYRSLEHNSLVTLLANRPSAVVAVAGGLVAREDTYELLRRHSVTFWLKADPQDHWDRVLQQDPRPMANDPNAMAQLQTILKRREPLYALAHHTVDTSELGLTQSVREIVARYREQN